MPKVLIIILFFYLIVCSGLALLQSQKQVQNLHNKLMDVPDQLIEDAAFFHQFAEAAYTVITKILENVYLLFRMFFTHIYF